MEEVPEAGAKVKMILAEDGVEARRTSWQRKVHRQKERRIRKERIREIKHRGEREKSKNSICVII